MEDIVTYRMHEGEKVTSNMLTPLSACMLGILSKSGRCELSMKEGGCGGYVTSARNS